MLYWCWGFFLIIDLMGWKFIIIEQNKYSQKPIVMQINLSDKVLNSSFPMICFISSFFGGFLTPFMLVFEGICTIILAFILPKPFIIVLVVAICLMVCLLMRSLCRALARKTSLYEYFQNNPQQRDMLVEKFVNKGELYSMETKEMKKILRLS